MTITKKIAAYSILILSLLLQPSLVQATDAPKLITNRESFRELKGVQERQLQSSVYDLSFVAYDVEFAKEFGLLGDHVTEMDEGLRFMEVRMVTEGAQTNCYYNLVLDKAVKLDFPERDYVANTSVKVMPINRLGLYSQKFPKDFDPHTDPLVQKFKKRGKLFSVHLDDMPSKFRNRTYLGSYDLTVKPFAKVSHSVRFYIPDNEVRPYQMVSIGGTGCTLDANVFQAPRPSIGIAWNTDHNYLQDGFDPNNFKKFLIPNSIVKQFAPHITQFQTIARMNKRR